jgi:hypothetical protein
MQNLNNLTLYVNIIRLIIIDGIHLDEKEKILIHMLHLTTFIFNICTILLNSEKNYFLFINYIRNTFINWKYSPISYCINHFLDGYTYYQIYSISFKMIHFMYLTNSFSDYHLQFVTDLTLYDTPFDFFSMEISDFSSTEIFNSPQINTTEK